MLFPTLSETSTGAEGVQVHCGLLKNVGIGNVKQLNFIAVPRKPTPVRNVRRFEDVLNSIIM